MKEVLEFLESRGDFVRALAIAKAVAGPDAVVRDVNSILYELKRKGQAEEVRREKGRFWKALLLEAVAGPDAVRSVVNNLRPGAEVSSRGRQTREGTVPESLPPEAASDSAASGRTASGPNRTAATQGSAPEEDELVRECVRALQGTQLNFSNFADKLAARPPDQRVEKVREEVKREAANIWPGKEFTLRPIGSMAMHTDIVGSDIDYSLHFEGYALEAELDLFTERLNESLPELVERGNISIKVGTEPRPVDIVLTNADFMYDRVPYSSLFGDCKDRAKVQERLEGFFGEYRGARNAARVLTALLLPLAERPEPHPWSFLVRGIVYDLGMRTNLGPGTASRPLQEDESGMSLFRKCLAEFAAYPWNDQQSPITLAIRHAVSERHGTVHKKSFKSFARRARKILK